MPSDPGSDEQEKSEGNKRRLKPTKAEIYQNISSMINRRSRVYSNFEQKFFITMPEPGSYVLIEEQAGKIARVVNPVYIASCLIKHLEKYLSGWRLFSLDSKEALAAVAYWMSSTEPVAAPLMICQKTDANLTFHRLPWDYEEVNNPTPDFDEFIGRCSNGTALQCFIGSLFEPHSDRSQYIWLAGEGGAGKGTFTTMLSKIFGPIYCAPGVPTAGDGSRFWTAQLHKKRLAVISECEDTRFVKSALFKALTGNDNVAFEQKREKVIFDTPTIKFICSSNHSPGVSRGREHQRRIIFCKVDPVAGGIDKLIAPHIMDARWWAEAPSIISKCIKTYRKTCPTLGPIPSEDEAYEEAVGDAEVHFDGLFDNYFEIDKSGSLKGAVLEEWFRTIGGGLTFQEKRDFRDYIVRKHNISKYRSNSSITWKGLRKRTVPLSCV